MVPGVAFDPHGGRLGHGKGYFDRFLRTLRPEVPRIGLAFQCQIFADVPMAAHDVSMTKILTEEGLYEPAAVRRHDLLPPGLGRSTETPIP